MATSDDPTPVQEDVPAERRCPDCGYLLIGLRPEGICPECGLAYDDQEIVLHGWPPGQAPAWGDTRTGQLVLGGLIVGVITLIAILTDKFSLPGIMGIFLLAVLIVAAVIFDRHRQIRRQAESPRRVEATSFGVGQRDGPGTIRLKRWTPKMYIRMRGTWTGRHRLTIVDRDFLSIRLESQIVDLVFEGELARAHEVLRQLQHWSERWDQRKWSEQQGRS